MFVFVISSFLKQGEAICFPDSVNSVWFHHCSSPILFLMLFRNQNVFQQRDLEAARQLRKDGGVRTRLEASVRIKRKFEQRKY